MKIRKVCKGLRFSPSEIAQIKKVAGEMSIPVATLVTRVTREIIQADLENPPPEKVRSTRVSIRLTEEELEHARMGGRMSSRVMLYLATHMLRTEAGTNE